LTWRGWGEGVTCEADRRGQRGETLYEEKNPENRKEYVHNRQRIPCQNQNQISNTRLLRAPCLIEGTGNAIVRKFRKNFQTNVSYCAFAALLDCVSAILCSIISTMRDGASPASARRFASMTSSARG